MDYIIILTFLLTYMRFWVVLKRNNPKNARLRMIKNITDLILVCVFYFSFTYFIICNPEEKNIVYSIVLGMSVAVFTHFVTFIVPFIIKVPQTNAIAKLMIVEIFYQWIFFAFVNLCVYIIDNSSYLIDSNMQGSAWHEIAIGFVYYVFCNAIMYEKSGITPISVWSKTLHILNIIIFAFVLVKWLNEWYTEKIKYEKINNDNLKI